MKKIIILAMLVAIGYMAKAQSQGYSGKYFNATQYMRSPIYFQSTTDTLATQAYARLHGGTRYTIGFGLGLSGSTLYNSRYWKNQDTLKTTLTGVPYLTSGVISIYSDIETNVTSGTTRLGRFSGTAEDESSNRSNVFIGNSSGSHVTTGSDNTFIGTATGTALTTGNNNVFMGRSSGFSATGNYNVMLGNFSGYSATGSSNTCVGYSSGTTFTSGNNNTMLGNYSGHDATGSRNVFLGNYAGYYETGSDKLFIDNQNRTDEATSRTNSLVYGVFNATPASQTLRINGKVGVLKAPTYALDVTGDVNVTGSFLVNGSPQLSIIGSTNSTTKTTKIGINAGYSENETATRNNVFMGSYSGEYTTTGTGNTYLGFLSGNISTTGSNNTYIGNLSGVNASGSNNLFIGANSGQYLAGAGTPRSNRLLIGMLDAGSEAGDTTKQLVYGYQDVLPSKSRITLNGKLYQNGELRDTANASHAGFMSKSQYTKLQNAYNRRLTSATGTAPLTLTLSSNALTGSVAQANTTTSGYLSSSDWNTFNGKIGGSGTSGNIAYFTGTGTIGNSPLITDGTNITSVLLQKSTASYESAPLGSELLSSSGWTSTDWTGDFATGFTHTTGNTTALTNTLAAVIGSYYQIAFTVTNRTAGSFTITFGGVASQTFTATNAYGPKATTTGSLSITPTSDFNGTIVISIKQITGTYSPTYAIKDNTGVNSFEIRSSLNTLNNTFIGKNAGRYNTTGYNNNFMGSNSGLLNTTGINNNFMGSNSGYSNTTGINNNFMGSSSGYSNTTGYNNNFMGTSSGYSNTTGCYNNFIGTNAGRYLSNGSTANTTSDYCTLIGNDTKVNADDDQNETVIGYNAIGNGSNTVTIGNTSILNNYFRGTINFNGGNATAASVHGTCGTTTGTTATDGWKVGHTTTGEMELNQQENLDMVFKTNSIEAARITSGGYFYKKGTFADIYVVGNSSAQSIANGTTYVKLTHYANNGESSNCTSDAANDKITITKAGRYRITANSSSYTGNAGITFTFQIFAGGTAISTIAPSERKFTTANDIFGGVMQGFYNASSVPVDIDVRCIHDSGTSQNITVKHSNLNVEYIGE